MVRCPWLLCLAALLVVEFTPRPHVPPAAAKGKQLDLELEVKRQLHDARREDGVYEPDHKSRRAVRRVLRFLRTGVAHRK